MRWGDDHHGKTTFGRWENALHDAYYAETDDLSYDAADEIERMQAEIERLREAIDTALMHLLRGEGVQAINTLLTTNLATTRKAEQ